MLTKDRGQWSLVVSTAATFLVSGTDIGYDTIIDPEGLFRMYTVDIGSGFR